MAVGFPASGIIASVRKVSLYTGFRGFADDFKTGIRNKCAVLIDLCELHRKVSVPVYLLLFFYTTSSNPTIKPCINFIDNKHDAPRA